MNALVDIKKAMAYDLIRILKNDKDKTVYTKEDIKNIIDAYIEDQIKD